MVIFTTVNSIQSGTSITTVALPTTNPAVRFGSFLHSNTKNHELNAVCISLTDLHADDSLNDSRTS